MYLLLYTFIKMQESNIVRLLYISPIRVWAYAHGGKFVQHYSLLSNYFIIWAHIYIYVYFHKGLLGAHKSMLYLFVFLKIDLHPKLNIYIWNLQQHITLPRSPAKIKFLYLYLYFYMLLKFGIRILNTNFLFPRCPKSKIIRP